MDLAALLAAGRVEDFNLARAARSRPDLFAADLAGAVLPGVDLSGANLSKADLSGADLTDATLVKADLTGIDGTGVRLEGALAVRARMFEAWLEDADLTDADLSRAGLADAVLLRSRAPRCRFVRANLREVDAREVQWPEVDLSESTLTRANFTGADLTRADLTEVTATGLILANARLDYIAAKDARLGGADLSGASLVGARLEGANLSGAKLAGADLSAADLTRANLSGADLTGARLGGAVLAHACLDQVDFSGLDLRDADLTGLDPASLGLAEEQVTGLANFGVKADPDAPLAIRHPAVCHRGGRFALLWIQDEGEGESAMRWATSGPDGSARGILPTSAEGLICHRVLPWGAGFLMALVQRRPVGPTLIMYTLTPDGLVGASESHPMGWTPVGEPIFQVDDDTLWIFGLTRRGPSALVQRYRDGSLERVVASQVPTAKGFLGRHHPVLACKGGVVIPMTRRGAMPPMRTPQGFRGRGAAAQHEERILLAWVEPSRAEDLPGGVRCAWLAPREDPRILALGHTDQVEHLEALASPSGAWVAWSERRGDTLHAIRALVPGAHAESSTCPGLDGIRLAPGTPDEVPGWALLLEGGGASLETLDGTPGGVLHPSPTGKAG